MRILRASAVRISTRTKSSAIVEPPAALVGRRRPCGPDHGDERDARAHGALDVRHEIHADADLADVAEEHARERAIETVVQPAGLGLRIAAAIADEDLGL